MRVAVLIAPFATATPDEQQALRLLQSNLLATGCVAIWPPDVLSPVLDDNDPDERELGLLGSAAIVTAVARAGGEAHVVGSRTTDGMGRDLDAWYAATPRTATHHRLFDLQK